jgi:hypothetical protein
VSHFGRNIYLGLVEKRLMGIFRPKRGKEIHNVELHTSYSSPQDLFSVVKLRGMK